MLRKVYLEIGNICNLDCAFCPGTKRASHMLDLSEFRILTEKLCGHTEYLYFHLMGEPLLHPLLADMLQIAGEQGFHVMITTNGTLLSEKGPLLLDSSSVHKVNISLQAFEANEQGSLESYLNSCVDFAKKAAARGILCEFRLWNQGGLESRNTEILSYLAAAFPTPWEESRNGKRLADKIWLDPGDRFDWPDLSLEEQEERRFCYGLRDQIGVLCDGTVVPCCLDHEGDIPLGNLFTQELPEILESPRAQALREGFSRRQPTEELCRRCGYATRFNK